MLSISNFYAPQALGGGGHIVFGLSVCLFVCLSGDNFNVANNFFPLPPTHFIFGMPMYLIETLNLIPYMSRSRSGVKVKVEIRSWRNGGHSVSQTHLVG